jgi:hypothetical protein
MLTAFAGILDSTSRLFIEKLDDFFFEKEEGPTNAPIRQTPTCDVLVGRLNSLAQQLGCTLNPARSS